MKSTITNIINTMVFRCLRLFLRSFSQVMLQKSSITGGLFLLGIGLNSPTMLLGALMAIFSSLVIAKLGGYDLTLVNNGLYGFNAALAGIAIFFFFPINVTSCFLVILAGSISTVIMHIMLQFTLHRLPDFPVLTTPFIVTTWLLLFIEKLLIAMRVIENVVIESTITESTITESTITESIVNGYTANFYNDFFVTMRGVGQVMFQDYWLSGVLFIIALFLHSPKAALWAIIGSFSGMVIARTLNFPTDFVSMGLYGVNASLTAIALAERYSKQGFIMRWLVVFGILLSVLFTWTFMQSQLAALTAPFVLATWVIIAINLTVRHSCKRNV